MSPIKKMIELGLLSWSTIFLGLKKGWVKRNDVIDYAVSLLVNGNDSDDVVIIAGGESLSDEELWELVSNQMKHTDNVTDLDKWRLAHLLCIAESNEDEQVKIDNLQEVYASFNYPEDMASCSVYSQDELDVLLAMMKTVKELSNRFTLLKKD